MDPLQSTEQSALFVRLPAAEATRTLEGTQLGGDERHGREGEGEEEREASAASDACRVIVGDETGKRLLLATGLGCKTGISGAWLAGEARRGGRVSAGALVDVMAVMDGPITAVPARLPGVYLLHVRVRHH